MARPEAHSFIAKDRASYTFLFDHSAIIAAEKLADAGFAKLLAGLQEGRFGFLVALITAGLQHHHPAFTIDDAWELLEAEGEELGLALGEAIKSAMPKPGGKATEGNPPKARKAGTGTPSSPRGSRKGSTKPAS